MRKQKDNYLTQWKELTKKQSKLECYLAEYPTTVTDPKWRKALTMYRLSEQSLAIEKGCRRQTWLTLTTKLGGNWAVFPNLLTNVLYDLYYRHIFPSDYTDPQRIWKQIQFRTTPISIGWNTTVCDHSSKICDLMPQEKDNQWRTNTNVNTAYIYLHIVTSLYIDIMWHLKCLYYFGTGVCLLFIFCCLFHFCFVSISLTFGVMWV